MEEKSTTGKELGTILLGVITTIVTAIVCSWLEINLGVAIYTFMVFFIITAGAVVFCGRLKLKDYSNKK